MDMLRWLSLLVLLSIFAFAQKPSTDNEGPGPNQDPPRSSAAARESGDSSSRDSIIDLTPPKNDAKDHPDSESVADQYDQTQEFHPWDPHKADKNIEVGDYYFKQGNYRAAESRYREALHYQYNNAVATFDLAQALEKLGKRNEAIESYGAYLKILPHGPKAEDAKKAITHLKTKLTEEHAEARKESAASAKSPESPRK